MTPSRFYRFLMSELEEANINICRLWFEEVWNKGREVLIDDMFAPDGVSHGLSGTDSALKGPAHYKAFFKLLRGAFPDLHLTIHEMVAEGETVAVRWTAVGTYKAGSSDATDKQAEITGMSFLHVRGGKIVETWVNWDLAGLIQQIGMVPVAKLL